MATARGDRDVGREKARGEADAQNEKCTTSSTDRSIGPGADPLTMHREAVTVGACQDPRACRSLQIAVLSVVIFVGIKILFALLVFGVTVATGGWTDRP